MIATMIGKVVVIAIANKKKATGCISCMQIFCDCVDPPQIALTFSIPYQQILFTMSVSNIVQKATFEGCGRFEITQNKVVCDQKLETTKIPGGYAFRAKTASGISFLNNSISTSGGVSVVTTGDKAIVRNGSEYYEIGSNQMSLNGITYNPFVPKHGCYSGKKVFLPIGFLESYFDSGGSDTQVKIEEPPAKEVKEYVFDSPVKLTNIESSGQAQVYVGSDVTSDSDLRVTTSGQSLIKLNNYSVLSGILKIITSGQSSVDGCGIRATHLNAASSGQSSIRNAHGNNSVDVNTSGQSSARVSASPGANVDKGQTGQSTCIVARTML